MCTCVALRKGEGEGTFSTKIVLTTIVYLFLKLKDLFLKLKEKTSFYDFKSSIRSENKLPPYTALFFNLSFSLLKIGKIV